MDELDGVPCSVLGYHIKTRTQICLTCCVTAVLELLVYVLVLAADAAVIAQHFRDGNPLFAWMTLLWLVLPAVVCFGSVVTSPWQWPSDEVENNFGDSSSAAAAAAAVACTCGWTQVWFLVRQLSNLLFFPIGAIYRLARRIFWSVEAMFHERDTAQRRHATAKAAETSPFELYHFLQAFVHAAPQIMLQFAILLREDVFRNYETTHMQVLSIVMSLITMAFVTGTYQRFESQHIVGRNYPWSSRQQIAWRRRRFQRTTVPLRTRSVLAPTAVEGTLSGVGAYTEVPASEHVMRRFAASATPSTTKSMHLGEYNFNEDNDDDDDDDNGDSSSDNGDVDKIRSFLRNRSIESNMDTVDMPPSKPPPPPPPASQPLHIAVPSVGAVMNRMSTFKDMMLLKTELYLRDNVPRLPTNFHLNITEPHKPDNIDTVHQAKAEAEDTADADLQLPTRRPTIDGIEQDDFLGKAVSFTAWTLVLLQRMLALSAFAYFHPIACLGLCGGHYVLMLVALLVETRLHEKAERLVFYVFLAYVYVFCIVEFKIKFRRPRRTLLAYAVLVMVQNVVVSVWWFGRREHGSIATAVAAEQEAEAAASISSAWWFGFMFAAVLLSGTYALMCWVVYYYLLKPSARVLFEAAAEGRAADRRAVGDVGGAANV